MRYSTTRLHRVSFPCDTRRSTRAHQAVASFAGPTREQQQQLSAQNSCPDLCHLIRRRLLPTQVLKSPYPVPQPILQTHQVLIRRKPLRQILELFAHHSIDRGRRGFQMLRHVPNGFAIAFVPCQGLFHSSPSSVPSLVGFSPGQTLRRACTRPSSYFLVAKFDPGVEFLPISFLPSPSAL